jgi:hypothetical protein
MARAGDAFSIPLAIALTKFAISACSSAIRGAGFAFILGLALSARCKRASISEIIVGSRRSAFTPSRIRDSASIRRTLKELSQALPLM